MIPIVFKGYRYDLPEKTVMANQIESWEMAEHGTRLTLLSGREILVGEWPSSVEKKVREALNATNPIN